jgi:threonine-phosphate decarboxylase
MNSEPPILFEHGGDLEKAALFAGCRPEEILDFSNLLNPSGAPPGLTDYLKSKLSGAFSHPGSGEPLRRKIAEKTGIAPEQILLGAGTTEFVHLLPQVRQVKRPVILGPTYGDYEPVLRAVGADPRFVLARETENWEFPRVEWERALVDHPDWVILARPNNPLGQNWPMGGLLAAIEKYPETFFVVDETCLEVSEDPKDSFWSHPMPANLAVLRSFSKAYAVPGLRLGYLAAPTDLVGRLKQARMPWTVSPLALEAGLYLLDQDKWVVESHQKNLEEKKRVYTKLSALQNFKTFSSAITAFTMKGLAAGFSSSAFLKTILKEEKILIRSLAQHRGLGDAYFRIGLRTPAENDRLLKVLEHRVRS